MVQALLLKSLQKNADDKAAQASLANPDLSTLMGPPCGRRHTLRSRL
jgi:hypothetical protein